MSSPKQPLTVYSVMIVISTLCMLAACILMAVELSRWGMNPWEETGVARPRASLERSIPAESFASQLDSYQLPIA